MSLNTPSAFPGGTLEPALAMAAATCSGVGGVTVKAVMASLGLMAGIFFDSL